MMKLRVGQGYDIHRLTANRKFVLGGFELPDQTLGLMGHSDADVLLHAIIDALLGGLALGDIGQWFPDTDPQYKDINSAILLNQVLTSPAFQGWEILNLDTTLIAQAPRLAPHIPNIRQSLAKLLHCPIDSISVKAKTNERLDAVGKCEAIAAQAVVLLSHNSL